MPVSSPCPLRWLRRNSLLRPLQFGIGASGLHLDDIEFTAVTDFFVTEVQDHQSNHDGDFNGYKLTGELTGLLPHRRGEWLAALAVRGFYARYEDEQQSRCVFTADTDCAFFPLFDPEPTGTWFARRLRLRWLLQRLADHRRPRSRLLGRRA